MSELIKIYPDNIHPREIQKALAVLKKGGLIIYPYGYCVRFGL